MIILATYLNLDKIAESGQCFRWKKTGEQAYQIPAFGKPISHYFCDCGEKTALHDLKMVHLKCKCGSQYNYRTNITDKVFDFPCLKCGNPVDLELNKRGDTYVTIGE